MQEVVNLLGENIIAISSNFSSILNSPIPPTTTDITNPQMSTLTDIDSAMICIAGGDSDSGTNCQ